MKLAEEKGKIESNLFNTLVQCRHTTYITVYHLNLEPSAMQNTSVAYVLLFLILYACTPDDIEIETRDAFAKGDDLYVTVVSYELETVTERELTDKGQPKLAFIDQIAGEQVASRQAIRVGIDADGNADFVVVEKISETDVTGKYRDGNLPNLNPAIARTEITDGVTRLYDRAGTLLYEHDIGENFEARSGVIGSSEPTIGK